MTILKRTGQDGLAQLNHFCGVNCLLKIDFDFECRFFKIYQVSRVCVELSTFLILSKALAVSSDV